MVSSCSVSQAPCLPGIYSQIRLTRENRERIGSDLSRSRKGGNTYLNNTKPSAALSSPPTVLSSSHNSLMLADVPASVLCPRLPNARKILRSSRAIFMSGYDFVSFRAIPSPAFVFWLGHRRFSPSPALSTLVPLFALASRFSSFARPLRAQCGCSLYVVRCPECHSGIKNNSDISAAAVVFVLIGTLIND